MRLLEFQAKDVLASKDIPVPGSRLIGSSHETGWIGAECVLKAQVPIGRRGKSGGIRKVRIDEMEAVVEEMLSMTISGYPVRSVLAEEVVDFSRELYLSIVLDREHGPLILASSEGGVDIEEVKDVLRLPVHPFIGIRDYHVRYLSKVMGLREEAIGPLIITLWDIFIDLDCELVEINPLVVLANGSLMALDAKITVNEDSLFRQEELAKNRMDLSTIEAEAKAMGISLVLLEGDIAVIANGAGLTMATLDKIEQLGGAGGAFLDLGGTDDPLMVASALGMAMGTKPKAVLVNIFGGITKCDTVAEGILSSLDRYSNVPIVTRISGVNEVEARRMLSTQGIIAEERLEEACLRVVEVAHAD